MVVDERRDRDGLAPHAPGSLDHVGQREGVEVLAHVFTDLRPHRQQHALAFMLAGAVLVRSTEVASGDRAVDRGHDLAEGDLLRWPGEHIAAPDAPLGADQPRALERKEDLFEVRLRQTGALGQVANRRRARLVGMQCERQECPARVVAAGGHPHDSIVAARGPRARDRAGSLRSPAVSNGSRSPGASGSAERGRGADPSFGAIPLADAGPAPASTAGQEAVPRGGAEGSVGAEPGAAPVFPDYEGACITNVVPALLGDGPSPSWLPPMVLEARQVVLLVVDGLGWRALEEHRPRLDVLGSAIGGPITSVVPSSTATALTSITTGLPPAVHGIVGYRMRVEPWASPPQAASEEPRAVGTSPTVDRRARPATEGAERSPARTAPTVVLASLDDQVLNVLRWRTERGDARQRIPPRTLQPNPAFRGRQVPVVSRAEFATTGFTAAHLGTSRHIGWRMPSTMVVAVRELLREGAPLVYAYYDGPDKVAHEHGLGCAYVAELLALDQLVGAMAEALPPGVVLVITSDHGQVDCGAFPLVLEPDVLEMVSLVSGEGRFRWLHAQPGAAASLAEAASERYGADAWVFRQEELESRGAFGGPLAEQLRARLGDVALVAREPVSFLDPADPGEALLKARHGSLTAAEMLVPLLAIGSV
jgi:hypothetical protein